MAGRDCNRRSPRARTVTRVPSVLWFRRDLRLADHPALSAAAESDGQVAGLFVLDPTLLVRGRPRTERLLASLAALDEQTGGRLIVRSGRPEEVVAALAREVGATTVHVSEETTPYGRRRDDRVRAALERDGRELIATGSPYAVTPGRVLKDDGTPYRVFTPFSRAWRQHGWRAAAEAVSPDWISADGEPVEARDDVEAGEAAALARWRAFRDERLDDYGDQRNRPDLDTTSRLSVPLKYGEIHPRTILGDIARRDGAGRFVDELCWREFYADVLLHNPASAWNDLTGAIERISYDDPDPELFGAWQEGRTGFPFVDAGMRQLLAEGWMHNRVRMVTASFLTKDLHIWWPHGARHFLDHLIDGDIASNNHGWQWVAGTGTDASPYFRVFNPVTQGLKFDPAGDYVRRWVPELRHLEGKAAHEPWKHPGGYDHGYPRQIVDHGHARAEALARYELARA